MNDKKNKFSRSGIAAEDVRKDTDVRALECPGPAECLPASEIHSINKRHIQQYDRFYRMQAGSSLDLRSFQGGVVELELYCPEFHYRKRLGAVRSQIGCWARESLLASARTCVIHVYSTSAPFGDHQATEPLTQPRPDIKIDEIRGNWSEWARELQE